MSKDASIVITGAAGFIGSNTVRALNSAGFSDIVIVDCQAGDTKRKNLTGLKYKDYIDRDDFLELIKKGELKDVGIIIHLGACTDTTEDNEKFMMENNFTYSQRIFNYCLRSDSRLIYASSAATYGGEEKNFDDAARDLAPLNCYGRSKHLFDEWVRDGAKKPPQWVGLKFFNVYGPGEEHKGRMASMAYQCCRQASERGEVRLFKSHRGEYKDGEQKRDFIYVKDAVKVIRFFLENKDRSGIFNVGTGQARTFIDLALAVFKVLNKKPRITFFDIPEAIRDKYQYLTEADINNLRQAGYKEKFYSLEEGVRDYVQNYLQNR